MILYALFRDSMEIAFHTIRKIGHKFTIFFL